MNRLKSIKCFLLDLDGTVYLSGQKILGADSAIARMRQQGEVYFITNNSSASQSDYLEKLNKINIIAEKPQIITSGTVTIDYLKKAHKDKSVYLLGTKSLKQEFKDANILLSCKNPDIVVVAFDKSLTYKKLQSATTHLLRGAFFIATHPDLTCPTSKEYIPDVGSFLALIKAATNKEPDIICGKPSQIYADYIKRLTGCDSSQIAVFGDRLSTDIHFAKKNDFLAVLVLSGETKLKDLEKSKIKPDLILDSINDFDR